MALLKSLVMAEVIVMFAVFERSLHSQVSSAGLQPATCKKKKINNGNWLFFASLNITYRKLNY